jgi:hypothetical protein
LAKPARTSNIVELLGGRMGVIYKTEDVKHDRFVVFVPYIFVPYIKV